MGGRSVIGARRCMLEGVRKGARFLGLLASLAAGACSRSPTPGGPCQSTRNCVAGEVCVAGTCTAGSKTGCDTDDECMVGQWCDQADRQCKTIEAGDSGVPPTKDAGLTDTGTSTTSGCTRDDQCGGAPANICMANQCVKGCNQPGGLICTGGTQCDAATGHCAGTNGSCTLDAECVPGPPSQICINQECVLGCGADPTRCAPGTEVCDTNTGRCVPAPEPCADDTGCHPPMTVCESTQCVPGCGSTGGIQCTGATPMCDPASGRCLPPPSCQLDSQCTGANEICVNNVCLLRCDQAGGLDCGAGVCNPNDGRCLPGDLPLGDQTCIFDEQCAAGICLGLTIDTQSIQVCTNPCGASSQCPLDYSCIAVSGMGFCLSENVFTPPATFDTPAGGACSTTVNTCQSFWCNTGTNQCIETCSRDSDCASYGGNCWMYTQDNAGTPAYDHLCFQQPTLNITGVVCTTNDNCRSGICNRYSGLCAAHCCSDADCPAAQSCGLYDVDANTIVKICANRNAGAGTAVLGAACTIGSDCESEVCIANVCSTLCCSDADCAILPLGGKCEPIGTPIASQIVGACTSN